MSDIPFGRPIIGDEERAAVMAALDDPILAHGPRGRQFEADFAAWTGAPEAITVSSCTAGLHLAWFTAGIGPGDEVIVPAQTHTATAHAVAYTGATPVFVDAERNTGNIDIDAIAAAVGPKTKGISVVHYLGMPVDMVRVMEIAKANDLFVVEDCALAIGTSQNGTHAGLFGDAGVFSFYPVKHMTTAEGGMVITRDGELAQRLRLRKAFGVDRAMHERKVPGIYDVVTLGYNFRMNELQAAIGIEQVKKLDRFLAARTANFDALDAGLREMPQITLFDRAGDGFVSSHYCFNMMLDADKADRRTDVIQALNARGIGTSVHYPGPVPQTTYYRDRFGHKPEDHPAANWISNCSIALPVGPHLDESHMATIVAAVKDVISEVLT